VNDYVLLGLLWN